MIPLLRSAARLELALACRFLTGAASQFSTFCRPHRSGSQCWGHSASLRIRRRNQCAPIPRHYTPVFHPWGCAYARPGCLSYPRRADPARSSLSPRQPTNDFRLWGGWIQRHDAMGTTASEFFSVVGASLVLAQTNRYQTGEVPAQTQQEAPTLFLPYFEVGARYFAENDSLQ